MISRIAGTNIVSAYTPIAEMEERIIIIQAYNGIACIAQSAQFVDLCAQCTMHIAYIYNYFEIGALGLSYSPAISSYNILSTTKS
jgi:hypothetical protein